MTRAWTRSCAACSVRKGLIFLMLWSANLQDRAVFAMCSLKVSWSSRVTRKTLVLWIGNQPIIDASVVIIWRRWIAPILTPLWRKAGSRHCKRGREQLCDTLIRRVAGIVGCNFSSFIHQRNGLMWSNPRGNTGRPLPWGLAACSRYLQRHDGLAWSGPDML